MDLAPGGNAGSGDDRDREDPWEPRNNRKLYHRHSADKIQLLETFFKGCPHPDERQRQQLSRELGLELKQIKFWFQNKRTQTKAHNQKASNSALRAENEQFHVENGAMKEALENVMCLDCERSGYGVEARQRNLQRLRNENAWLRREHDRLVSIVSSFCKRGNSPFESLLTPTFKPLSHNSYEPEAAVQDTLYGIDTNMLQTSSLNIPNISSSSSSAPTTLFRETQEMKKSLMMETAISAMDELVELLRVDDEPLWIRSSIDGTSMIHHESYQQLYPKISCVNGPQTWIESSKESGIVSATAIHLVDIFQDPRKWMEFFPTIVTEARTINEAVDSGNQGRSLQLMYEKLHVLSHFVVPREFLFLRYIQQLNPSTWLIAQVSHDILKESDASCSHAWMLPSGCKIQDLSNGKSKVTWIEHVQVDDKSRTHQMYKDIVRNSQAYGAKRWLVTLQWMCDRLAFSMGSRTSPGVLHELERVIDAPQSRMSMIKLSQKMVKNFHGMLSMKEKSDFPQYSEYHKTGFRVSMRSQGSAMVVCISTSIRLPISLDNLFNFFKDDGTRAQWDVMSNGNPLQEIAHISTGSRPGNCVSLMQPYITKDNTNMLILQESCIDTLGASLIYAPIEYPAVTSVISTGQDNIDHIPVLPSGFVISTDHGGADHDRGSGRINLGPSSSSTTTTTTNTTTTSGCRSAGGMASSLLTVGLQILVTSHTFSDHQPPNLESVATIHALINSTIQKIKMAISAN